MKFHVILLSSVSVLLQEASAFQSNPCAVAHFSRTQPSFSTRHNQWSLAAANENEEGNPFGFLQGLFQPSNSAVEEPAKPEIPDVVIDSDYKLAAAFGALGIAIIFSSHASGCTSTICPPSVGGAVFGGIISLLASLFAVQATRIRFVFDKEAFELANIDVSSPENKLYDSGENIIVGGANRWMYDSFVNWDFYPSVDFPILVYFKETQTQKPDGSYSGQVHFFPAIANCKQLQEQFELRGCAKVAKN
eukprot:CAMPEP_0171328212 /NCGR_PEP_ID=MMETSP0878-20121228/518_1 /TAXON_ID=67004 /ORGANISM="Thalassiosira weissflogii, Strain CCMP1336" /LENGTH=247 /DNA_ID=CAMNT_0011828045 /DNA_START=28 /DNA_END=771 /DNA_ORIENTATION=+